MTRLLFNCDDFGKTHEVNAAVLKAHTEGVLGSASLMVAGDAVEEAVGIARAHPMLKTGLHVVLNDGRPALPPGKIPSLVGPDGLLLKSPAAIGIRLACCGVARSQAAAEIAAQFERFETTGLPRHHVDGHHHLHMHPFVFRQCVRHAERAGFARIRVTREFGNPLPPRRDGADFVVKLARHLVFLGLAAACRRALSDTRLKACQGVLGLWETGRMNEAYLLKAIPNLPSGDWEIYSHPGSGPGGAEELAALLGPQLKTLLQEAGSHAPLSC